jgi:hypothetical protein
MNMHKKLWFVIIILLSTNILYACNSNISKPCKISIFSLTNHYDQLLSHTVKWDKNVKLFDAYVFITNNPQKMEASVTFASNSKKFETIIVDYFNNSYTTYTVPHIKAIDFRESFDLAEMKYDSIEAYDLLITPEKEQYLCERLINHSNGIQLMRLYRSTYDNHLYWELSIGDDSGGKYLSRLDTLTGEIYHFSY